MKLIIAILADTAAEPVSAALTKAGLRVTHVASTGGLLRRGQTTMLIGLENEQVDQAVQLIHDACPPTEDADQKQATIFVVNVQDFVRV